MIAVATYSGLPDSDDDWPLLRAELVRAGVSAEVVAWDAPNVDWAGYELVVVRTTWDYTDRPAEFQAWAAGVPNLLNPAPVLRWNTDKRYLQDLADAGVPVVPTLWDPTDLPAGDGWEQFVIKPAVSAGSRDTARWGPGEDDAARAHLRMLAEQGRTAMVQPYLRGVDIAGEKALVFLDGKFSHAVRKAAILTEGGGVQSGILADGDPREQVAPAEPATAELAVAEFALGAIPWRSDLLYARVDLVPGVDGEPVLLELELTEPSLFLAYADDAAARLAEAIARRLIR